MIAKLTGTHPANTIFQDNFRMCYKQKASECVADFEVIFLTDIHYAASSMMKNAWLIDQLYEPGDIVLVESPNQEQTQDFFQTRCVTKNITVAGWDDPKSDEAIHVVKDRIPELIKELKSESFALHTWVETLSDLIEHKDFPAREKVVFAERINALKENGVTSYVAVLNILRELQPVWRKSVVEATVEATFTERQQSLFNKIDQQSGNRVFVIAGNAHIAFMKELGACCFPEFPDDEYEKDARYDGVELLRKKMDKKSKSYVVLTGDFTPISDDLKNKVQEDFFGEKWKLETAKTCIFALKILNFLTGLITSFVMKHIERLSVVTGRPSWFPKFHSMVDQFTRMRVSFYNKNSWIMT